MHLKCRPRGLFRGFWTPTDMLEGVSTLFSHKLSPREKLYFFSQRELSYSPLKDSAKPDLKISSIPAHLSSCWGLQTSPGLAPKLRRALKRTSKSSYNPKRDLGAGLHWNTMGNDLVDRNGPISLGDMPRMVSNGFSSLRRGILERFSHTRRILEFVPRPCAWERLWVTKFEIELKAQGWM